MNESIASQKQRLRSQFREKRRNLSPEQQQLAASNCAQLLIQSQLLKEPLKFALYLTNDGELDPQFLIDYLWRQGKETYLPVIECKKLVFAHYHRETALANNLYGIPEPQNSKICPVEQLDIIFMPLVAFDESGQRLGMGGGYYDRTLADNTQIKTIGLAYQFQRQNKLPVERWDQPLNAVATPERLYQF